MKKIYILLITVCQLLVTQAKPALAVICNPVLKDCTPSTAPKAYVNSVISNIISIFFIVGVLYFIWHIVFAGYHLIGAQGDTKNFESAKNELTYSFMGLIVMFAVFAILKIVGTVFGITGLDTLQIVWPTL